MYPITTYIQRALSFFTLNDVHVQDIEYIKVSGIDKEQDAGIRVIEAAIDPSNMDQLEILFGVGNVSAGDLLIYTKEDLYIADIFDPGDPRKQSFLTYGGFSYRILARQNWQQQVGIHVYQGERHVRQEIPVIP